MVVPLPDPLPRGPDTVSYTHLEEILLVRILVSGFFPLAFFRFPQVIPDMVCIGKTLYHAVIRDGNGPMSPFVGPLYNVLGLGAVSYTPLDVYKRQ